MELRQIRYFQRVAAELSFTRAAKALHMAQPPLSRQIKMLEEEIGVELFERAGRGIRLTEAGRYFLDQTDLMTRKLSETIQATQRIGRQEKRRFGVGFVPSVLYGYMPGFIRRLRKLDPNVEISLAEMITLQQFEALKTGRIDIGIGRILLTDPEIERLVLWDERLIAAVPRESGLAARAALTVEDMLPETLILYPARPRPSYADHVLDIFRRGGASPSRVKEVNELQTALGLVAAGVGLAVVPESVHGLFRDEVAYVPIDERGFSSPVMLSWRKNDQSEFLRATLALAHGVGPVDEDR
ncbi:LysR family transcriptional regulator [Parapusillimonas granuli]|uniref:LysR family transcriptional regulator n=1 Tax=Parapusillimonas granuli TaxID=380911 RepID=A0A853FXJ0_9BURK|nr:LysR family transcriptional regulator [Parapusillimonas granuli]MBB5215957.1 DNA-binding transcriptional LysR family regulator [Parapusillimonas granuli]MEB2399360.1 LysR family transcriptional regulator [Alcaligenaceae bacterium]NYT50745.1 LysR family transcriptional regulator [Parapusillimonas granuli]